jgi:hypothetical protein
VVSYAPQLFQKSPINIMLLSSFIYLTHCCGLLLSYLPLLSLYFAMAQQPQSPSQSQSASSSVLGPLVGINVTVLLKEWLAGGLANAITSAIVNPLDVSKTRIQVYQSRVGEDVAKSGLLSNSGALRKVFGELYADGGLIGLWRPGLTASMWRELFYSGLRTGFYVPVRDAVNDFMGKDEHVDGHDDISLSKKIVSAMITGTMGSLLANPIDVVKIRLMINPRAYSSTWSGVYSVYKADGFTGMYRGIAPSTLRAAFIAAGELATYDHSKVMLRKYLVRAGGEEGPQIHFIASVITGLVATTVAAPFDVIKTR